MALLELNLQSFAAHLEAIHCLDGSLSGRGLVVGHEAETLGQVGVPVQKDFGRHDGSVGGEHGHQVAIQVLGGQVVDEQIGSFGPFRLLVGRLLLLTQSAARRSTTAGRAREQSRAGGGRGRRYGSGLCAQGATIAILAHHTADGHILSHANIVQRGGRFTFQSTLVACMLCTTGRYGRRWCCNAHRCGC